MFNKFQLGTQPADFLAKAKLEPVAALVLLKLMCHINRSNMVVGTPQGIAEMSGMTLREFILGSKHLKKCDLIRKYTKREYMLNPDIMFNRGNKYINMDVKSHAVTRLSRMAGALLLPLILLSNRENEISKERFIKAVSWINDYRTWNKYWNELENKDVIIHLDKQVWMISPHECYAEGVSHVTLINKWNEARTQCNKHN